MAAFGSGGARRWIARKPIDTRPIVSAYETRGLWDRFTVICAVMGAGTLGLGVYAWIVDAAAGHIR